MQPRSTARIVQINDHPRFQARPEPEAETNWVEPGHLITIAKNSYIGIEYDQVDDNYYLIIKIWINGKRRKDRLLDENDQLDLRIHCRRIITLIKHNYHGDRPIESLIKITEAPRSWEKQK